MPDKEQIDFDSISELVPLAKNGDAAAFDSLLSQLRGYLAQLSRGKLNPAIASKEGHSDIVQLTLIQAVESFDSFRGTTAGEFNNWIKVILENTVKQVHRKYDAHKRDINQEQLLEGSAVGRLQDLDQTPGTLAAAKEEVQAFHQLLDMLPPDYATVIRLRSLEKRSFQEVAETMDRSYSSVTNLWYRAMLKLEAELRKE